MLHILCVLESVLLSKQEEVSTPDTSQLHWHTSTAWTEGFTAAKTVRKY